MNKNHYYGFDWLRGIAAFGIVGCHLALVPISDNAWIVRHLCDMNVGVFAAISGFLFAARAGFDVRRLTFYVPGSKFDVPGSKFQGSGSAAARSAALQPSDDPFNGEEGADHTPYSLLHAPYSLSSSDYILKRIKRLLPVYLVWTAVFLAATCLFDVLFDGGINPRYYSGKFWCEALFFGKSSAHLWFLIGLLYVDMIAAGLRCVMKNGMFVAVSAMISGVALAWAIVGNGYIANDFSRLAAFFFLGVVMNWGREWIERRNKCVGATASTAVAGRHALPSQIHPRRFRVCAWGLLAVGIALQYVLWGKVPQFALDYVCTITVMAFFMSRRWLENRVAKVLAGTSLGVYLVHPLFAVVGRFVCGHMCEAPYSAEVFAADWIAVWGGAMGCVMIWKRLAGSVFSSEFRVQCSESCQK